MSTHLVLLATSFTITVISMPLVIKLAFKTRFLDSPVGNPLKIHRQPIPVLGGMAIWGAVTSSLLIGTVFLEFSTRELVGPFPITLRKSLQGAWL